MIKLLLCMMSAEAAAQVSPLAPVSAPPGRAKVSNIPAASIRQGARQVAAFTPAFACRRGIVASWRCSALPAQP